MLLITAQPTCLNTISRCFNATTTILLVVVVDVVAVSIIISITIITRTVAIFVACVNTREFKWIYLGSYDNAIFLINRHTD